jgi:hypothetical protein
MLLCTLLTLLVLPGVLRISLKGYKPAESVALRESVQPPALTAPLLSS